MSRPDAGGVRICAYPLIGEVIALLLVEVERVAVELKAKKDAAGLPSYEVAEGDEPRMGQLTSEQRSAFVRSQVMKRK